MILRLSPEILEDGLFPVPLHIVPILNLTVPDGVVNTISGSLRIRKCLVADEEIEILDSSL